MLKVEKNFRSDGTENLTADDNILKRNSPSIESQLVFFILNFVKTQFLVIA